MCSATLAFFDAVCAASGVDVQALLGEQQPRSTSLGRPDVMALIGL